MDKQLKVTDETLEEHILYWLGPDYDEEIYEMVESLLMRLGYRIER